MRRYYPVFVDLNDKPCAVIGAGLDVERKVHALLEAGGLVTVISPELPEGLVDDATTGRIGWIPRDYQPGDLQGYFLAISTLADRQLNARIQQEARQFGVLFNAVDDPANSSFIHGSVLRRGDLTVAICTGGAAPALAVRIRQKLEQLLGPEFGTFVALLGSLREDVSQQIPDFETRRRLWYELVDSPILELVRQNRLEEARELARSIIEAFASGQEASLVNCPSALAE